MNSIPLYLVWDGDYIDSDVKRIEQSDEPDRLRILFQKIDKANGILRSWAESIGGSIISLNGAAGAAEVPADRVAELPKIRVQYSEAIEAPFSVGVGSKLSEAQKALKVARNKGGDQILLYTPDLDQELDQAQADEKTSEDPLAKSLKGAIAGGAMAAGLMANPSTAYAPGTPKPQVAHAQPAPAPMPKTWTPAGLAGDMYPIAHLESSFGKRVAHKPNPSGPFHTAVGAVGLKPVTAHEEFLRNPDLQRRFPALFDKAKFLSALQSDPAFYNQMASAHWNRIKQQLHNKIDRVAYAWRWGKSAALHAAPERIKSDPYVQKYLALRAKGVYKMEREEFDLDNLIKDEPEPTSPEGNGFDKPKQEASEHSEGEATEHLFEEAPGAKGAPPDIQAHLHKLAAAQHESDRAQESQEEQDKELTRVKSGVLTILQHVKQLQPQFEELAQSNPEVYKTLLEMVQGMITMAKEFDASPISKSELEKAIPSVPKPGTRQHLHLPVGTRIDGKGKIKIQNPDGTVSWIEARSGQILSPTASQTLAGNAPVPNHALSSRSQNAKPVNPVTEPPTNIPKVGTQSA